MNRHKPPYASSPMPANKKGFGVAASPFNGIKIELGFVLIIGFILWLAADSITASITTQLLLLTGYGFIGAFWLVIRTQRIMRQISDDETKK